MPQGLQCFDASGKLVLDVTDRLTRVLGEVNTNKVNGSITDPNLSTGTFWYTLLTLPVDVPDDCFLTEIQVDVNGNNLTWTYLHQKKGAINASYIIIYGVF